MHVLDMVASAEFAKGIAPVAKHVVVRHPDEAARFAELTRALFWSS